MPFSSLVMSFSKFVSPGLPVQGPSEAHLQPVHSGPADPLGTVTQGDSAGGGETQAEKATPHRSTYSEPEKKPLAFPLCAGKAFGEDGVSAGGRVPQAHGVEEWGRRHLDPGHIRTPAAACPRERQESREADSCRLL